MARPAGTPKTGGRKKGTLNKKTQEQAEAIKESGLTPLEFMLRVLRDETAEPVMRLDAAHKAAPYVHAKLSSVEVTGKDGGPIRKSVTLEFIEP